MIPRDREQLTVPPDGKPLAAQPKWRQDFPVDWPQDEYISRRELTKFLVLTSLAFVVGQFWIVAQNFWRRRQGQPLIQQIARLDEIPVGGVRIFQYPDPNKPCVLVRLGEADFVAYDQQCTHLTCPVIPQPQANRLYCPCHEGIFDLATGHPLAGPPRRPLPRVRLEVRDGAIYATGFVEEAT